LKNNETEKKDIGDLIMKLKDRIMEKDHSVTGFNIGPNIGESAGQTIFHAHIHLIPRRYNDTPHPRGGARGRDSGKNVILRKEIRSVFLIVNLDATPSRF